MRSANDTIATLRLFRKYLRCKSRLRLPAIAHPLIAQTVFYGIVAGLRTVPIVFPCIKTVMVIKNPHTSGRMVRGFAYIGGINRTTFRTFLPTTTWFDAAKVRQKI